MEEATCSDTEQLTNSSFKQFPLVPYHGIVGHFNTEITVAVSVLENHPDLHREQQLVNVRNKQQKRNKLNQLAQSQDTELSGGNMLFS